MNLTMEDKRWLVNLARVLGMAIVVAMRGDAFHFRQYGEKELAALAPKEGEE